VFGFSRNALFTKNRGLGTIRNDDGARQPTATG
jgi:hypothetical protein